MPRAVEHEKEFTIESIIDATRLTGKDNGVYFLGPFSRRVNFAAQQNRALNLVYALREKGLEGPIAVVGAGLAGLTIASALIELGYEVDLLESKPFVLARQKEAKHRLVHPSLNAWPEHETLDPTTNLPMLNWSANDCKDVMAVIEAEWKPFKDRLGDRFHSAEVLRYQVQDTGIILLTSPAIRTKVFKTVIFAVGFEDEDSIENALRNSYWDEDNFEKARNTDVNARFIVSGIGDGGLIDALRLAHQQFDRGFLIARAAAALFNTNIAKAIKEAEIRFRSERTTANKLNLRSIYLDAAQNLPSNLAKYLGDSLVPVVGLVFLFAKPGTETEFEDYAAPIHKLLVAHAINNGTILFRRGKISIDAAKKISVEPPSEAPPMGNLHVLIRHGAKNGLVKLWRHELESLGDLEKKQRVLSDNLVNPLWRRDRDLVSIMTRNQQSHFERNFSCAVSSFQRIWAHLTLAKGLDDNGAKRFVIETEKLDEWWPKELFGHEVRAELKYPLAVARY